MDIKILSEHSYAQEMTQEVEPYLKEHLKEYWLDKSHGKQYCARYCDNESPKGIIIISHGFTESAEKFKELAWYFVKEGYCVYVPDHCGHGNSYRMNDDSSLVHVDRWQRFTDDLTEIAKLAKSEYPEQKLYLFGHSMGGGIAAAEVALEPNLFDKVILSSPMICPKTGKMSIKTARAIANAACKLGLGDHYVIGQKKYDGKGIFEASAGTSRPRFDYYEDKREANEKLQTNAPSYSWLLEAARLNDYLQHVGWRNICIPVLIFQAETELWVDNTQMNDFVHKLRKARKCEVTALRMAGSRHEIYNSDEKMLSRYLNRIFTFLEA